MCHTSGHIHRRLSIYCNTVVHAYTTSLMYQNPFQAHCHVANICKTCGSIVEVSRFEQQKSTGVLKRSRTQHKPHKTKDVLQSKPQHPFQAHCHVANICKTCGSIVEVSRFEHQTSTGVLKRSRTQHKPHKTNDVLQSKPVQVQMVACVPGVSLPKAEAIVRAFGGSMAAIVDATSTNLARVMYLGEPIGPRLGHAIWHALH